MGDTMQEGELYAKAKEYFESESFPIPKSVSRFERAIDSSAKYFKMAYYKDMQPEEFVEYMKNIEKIPIARIGHKIKSTKNPDKRVELLKDYVFERFTKADLLHYSLKVEKINTSKKSNFKCQWGYRRIFY